MIIEIKCTGGFAGVEQTVASVDSQNLADALRSRVEQTVAELGAWSKSQNVTGADQFKYVIAISGDGTSSGGELTIVDDGKPDQPPMRLVMELIDWATP